MLFSHLERCIAVVHGVFNKEILQHTDGQLPDLGPLLQGLGHLPQEQTHQKVVAAVFLREAELQALLCCSTHTGTCQLGQRQADGDNRGTLEDTSQANQARSTTTRWFIRTLSLPKQRRIGGRD